MGKVVFVNGALPGDRVLARLLRVKKTFAEAETLEFLSRGQATEPHCPQWSSCGGCPLQCMPYAGQLLWKQTLAVESLVRIGGLDRCRLAAVFAPVAPSPELRHFRNKMEFAFAAGKDGTVVAGLRERRTGRILPVPGCALMRPYALRLAQKTAELAQASGLAPYGHDKRGFWRFLTLRQGHDPEKDFRPWFCVCLTSPGSRHERRKVRELGGALLGEFSELAAFVHEERKNRDSLLLGQKRVLSLDAQGRAGPQAALLRLPLGSRIFEMDVTSFFQVNLKAAEILALLTQSFAEAAREGAGLLDAYCGVGAPGLLLAPRFARVFGFDRDRRATAYARRNAIAMDIGHCRYEAVDASNLPDGKVLKGDMVLLDPPRAGLSPEALSAFMAAGPAHILYISCNPSSLARDAALLSQRYSLERMAGVDLFPHTPGLECISLWQRI